MLVKNVIKYKKAITPILATLLLIVIAVAAVVVTYAWFMTYTSSATSQAAVIISIENIRFYGEPADSDRNRIDITVRNSGTSDTKIVRIYMGKSESNLVEVTGSSDLGQGKTLNAKSAITIKISFPIEQIGDTWESGVTYHFKVVSDGGHEAPSSKEAK